MNHDKPLISIIVPVYNVADYLPRCLDSIVAQTYRALDIILIDDGSTDHSGDICDQYALTDCRIRVVHQPNGGQSSARNAGLDVAKGDYIAFVDSDDMVSADYIEVMYRNLIDYDADISEVAFVKCPPDQAAVLDITSHTTYQYSSEEAIESTLYQKRLDTGVWCKLFKRELFDNVRFVVGVLYEDLEIIPRLYVKCGKIVWSGRQLYYYTTRNNSSLGAFSLKRLDVLDIVDDIERRLAHNPTLLRAAQDRKLSANFNILALLAVNGHSNSSHALRCWQNIKSLRFRSLCNSKVRRKNKLGILISYLGRHFTQSILASAYK